MTRGFEIFRGTLAEFAGQPQIRQARGGQRVHEVAVRMGDPLRVAVLGRAGVGVTSVIAALGRMMPPAESAAHVLIEVPIPGSELQADVDIVVIAEALKQEDRAVLTGSATPKVLLLNKADLTDPGNARGPWSAAVRRCTQYRAETGVKTLPLSAHVPLADIDGDVVDALRRLVDDPADTSSVDAFATSPHAVPEEMRRRLLQQLDLYPMGCAIGALRQSSELGPVALTALLHDLSGINAVVKAIRGAMAMGWYRRMRSALMRLRHIAMTGDLSAPIDTFLNGDDLVIAAMGCATDLATTADMVVGTGGHPEDHRCRALRWQRFAAGPVTEPYAAMGTDIYRGSLRLWRKAGGRL